MNTNDDDMEWIEGGQFFGSAYSVDEEKDYKISDLRIDVMRKIIVFLIEFGATYKSTPAGVIYIKNDHNLATTLFALKLNFPELDVKLIDNE